MIEFNNITATYTKESGIFNINFYVKDYNNDFQHYTDEIVNNYNDSILFTWNPTNSPTTNMYYEILHFPP